MTLSELRYIVALAREKNFSKAAVSCFVSQPTLSLAIKKLEDELGVLLFERGKTEAIITDVGKIIVSEAEAVLQRCQSIKQHATMAKDPLRGALRLGLIYTVAPYLLPSLVRQLMIEAPEMSLRLQENFTHRLLELLQEGALDVAIVAAPVLAPNLDVIPLYEEPFYVVVPKNHHWRQSREIPIDALAGQTLLMLGQGHCFRDQVLQVCPDAMTHSSSVDPTIEGVTLETIRHTVASGYGMSVLPATSRRVGEDDLCYLPFAPPSPTRQIVATYRRGFTRREALSALCRAVKNSSLSAISDVRYAAKLSTV